MALTAKERQEIHAATMQALTEVIGASGKAEELVKLTTQIVQAAKKLAAGSPDAMKNRATATLAEFVIAAKTIAKDTRAVDATSLQSLSSSKRAVEALVKELDAWHASQASTDHTDLSLDDILVQTSASGRADPRASLVLAGGSGGGVVGSGGSAGGQGGARRRSSPTENMAGAEHLKRLMNELRQQQDTLARKADPQANSHQHGDPEEILRVSVSALSRSTSQLIDMAGQKTPNKDSLVEPAITLARMVSKLLDLVDSLFVTKFPMRSQVRNVEVKAHWGIPFL